MHGLVVKQFPLRWDVRVSGFKSSVDISELKHNSRNLKHERGKKAAPKVGYPNPPISSKQRCLWEWGLEERRGLALYLVFILHSHLWRWLCHLGNSSGSQALHYKKRKPNCQGLHYNIGRGPSCWAPNIHRYLWSDLIICLASCPITVLLNSLLY